MTSLFQRATVQTVDRSTVRYSPVIIYTYFMDARRTVKTVSQGIRDDFGTVGRGQQFQMSALIPRDNRFDYCAWKY
ncbi:hypothetical protein DPMN_056088 [Dreissena polymorpha]|uniref:Uncharacterized protein n=1 Tax=Dreissena polymorpha TaxID=45954 RepID=A0A9D4HUP7_DREPO|nr:hypothetical protein DPMN_056088 [Dreissena polymorpha]